MKNVERRIGITFLGLRLLVAPQVRKQTPILHSTFIILNLNQFFYLLTKQLSKVISPAKQRFMWAVTTHGSLWRAVRCISLVVAASIVLS